MNIANFIFDKNKENMNKRALLYVDRQGREESWSYSDLHVMSSKAVNLLLSLGIKKGDRVFIYLDRSPETYFFVLGILKLGAVYCPLFPSFGSDAVRERFVDCQGSLIIAESRLEENLDGLPCLLVDREGDFNFRQRLLSMSPDFDAAEVSDKDIAIIHYTSGTTGRPKGAVHCHGAIVSHWQTSKDILGLGPGLKYWCTADPAWVTGTTYGILGPLSAGADILVSEPSYRLNQVLGVLERYKVEIWYTAPTLLRMLMREDLAKAKGYNLTGLKKIFSVGEALNPEVCRWTEENLGLTVYDTWFQTETGAIMIGYDGSFSKREGSMGKAIYHVKAEILNESYEPAPTGKKGHLALLPAWPSMFLGYWNNEDIYQSKFKNGWYITGDLASKDEEGYFYYLSREDDVINTAGHLVSPFEVESVLMAHPSVAETAVIGMPDKLMGETVKAFVVLKEDYVPSPQLQIEYRTLVRNKVSAYASPQAVEFIDELPKTESGKIIRRMLGTGNTD
ncbi:MAG: AMP-binding protein [Lutispora sp.]|nr:AMP-binding protein [Lutispora sp.]